MPSTVCPRGSDPFYTVTYYINAVTTSWTYSTFLVADRPVAGLANRFTKLRLLMYFDYLAKKNSMKDSPTPQKTPKKNNA